MTHRSPRLVHHCVSFKVRRCSSQSSDDTLKTGEGPRPCGLDLKLPPVFSTGGIPEEFVTVFANESTEEAHGDFAEKRAQEAHFARIAHGPGRIAMQLRNPGL